MSALLGRSKALKTTDPACLTVLSSVIRAFDFVAIDGFFDTGADRKVLRLAFADFPFELCASLAEGITSLSANRWRARAARPFGPITGRFRRQGADVIEATK